MSPNHPRPPVSDECRACSIALLLASPASLAIAGGVVFTAQSRSISGTVTAAGIDGAAVDSDSVSATDFAPFNASLDLSATAPGSRATVSGGLFHLSSLTPELISLSAGGLVEADPCSGACIDLSVAMSSSFSVTFDLTSTFFYSLSGILGVGQPPQCFDGGPCSFLLSGPDGAVVNLFTTSFTDIGGAGVLPPGTYSITSSASPAFTHSCPEFGSSYHYFSLYITLCPGDLDSSGLTDGADIALLLGAWATDDPVADINGSGVVDGADLGIVLADWGVCINDDVCLSSGHDCFTTGAPGCTNVVCCESVCDDDPFCCSVEWDQICVNAASSTCKQP